MYRKKMSGSKFDKYHKWVTAISWSKTQTQPCYNCFYTAPCLSLKLFVRAAKGN